MDVRIRALFRLPSLRICISEPPLRLAGSSTIYKGHPLRQCSVKQEGRGGDVLCVVATALKGRLDKIWLHKCLPYLV
eukprot:4332995-Amphidinium_carterae.2